jgi:hypothetical protein
MLAATLPAPAQREITMATTKRLMVVLSFSAAVVAAGRVAAQDGTSAIPAGAAKKQSNTAPR